ncbi:Nicotinamide nucleotide repair protein [Anaerohalosphaera lusitana]|uniref:NAD(P)H-hydrate epimerase n=1 Tax=Anaerohalosphaera lusitana TaxID=1936003 RepID=A0A1U9NPU5_9BACT|nr:NAD(P)H-hydrate epimerase [Anaerohalosphaera lusitana]AQT69536.1 Nicotinamide nucleotide repair protein [Anaerohalosphaera lusitana]
MAKVFNVRKYSPGDSVLSREEVRKFDEWAIEQIGVPSCVLMENAGRGCAEVILEHLGDVENPKVCIFAGIGNNGGDGFVIARHLADAGCDVKVVTCGDQSKIKGDAKTNLDIVCKMEIGVFQLDMGLYGLDKRVEHFAKDSDIIVDALFGTGLKGALRGNYPELIDDINKLGKSVVAVDIPSGLNCNKGVPTEKQLAIKANFTVTFAAAKRGFTSTASREYTGDVYVAGIGIEPVRM